MYTRNCRGRFIGFPAKRSNLMINYIGHLIQIFVFTLFWITFITCLVDWLMVCVHMCVCDECLWLCGVSLCSQGWPQTGDLQSPELNLEITDVFPGFCGWFQAIIFWSTDRSVISLYSRSLEHFLLVYGSFKHWILFERPIPNQLIPHGKGKNQFLSQRIVTMYVNQTSGVFGQYKLQNELCVF